MDNGYLSAGTVPYAFTEMLYSMGVHMLKTQLKAAAHFVIEGTKKLSYSRTNQNRGTALGEGFAFVQGSSLDILIQRFGLEVDPELFREKFFEVVDYWKRKQ